jgi:hypothetical protein
MCRFFQYRASVGGTDTVVRLDNLPAGAYTVRAFAVASGRWLRTQGRIVTEVPWIFAAPTGANKVTVYWGRSARCNGLSGALGHNERELSEQFGGAAGDGSAAYGGGVWIRSGSITLWWRRRMTGFGDRRRRRIVRCRMRERSRGIRWIPTRLFRQFVI